eukprot:6442294-Lingulodinium_polyedra.AAC.1
MTQPAARAHHGGLLAKYVPLTQFAWKEVPCQGCGGNEGDSWQPTGLCTSRGKEPSRRRAGRNGGLDRRGPPNRTPWRDRGTRDGDPC